MIRGKENRVHHRDWTGGVRRGTCGFQMKAEVSAIPSSRPPPQTKFSSRFCAHANAPNSPVRQVLRSPLVTAER